MTMTYVLEESAISVVHQYQNSPCKYLVVVGGFIVCAVSLKHSSINCVTVPVSVDSYRNIVLRNMRGTNDAVVIDKPDIFRGQSFPCRGDCGNMIRGTISGHFCSWKVLKWCLSTFVEDTSHVVVINFHLKTCPQPTRSPLPPTATWSQHLWFPSKVTMRKYSMSFHQLLTHPSPSVWLAFFLSALAKKLNTLFQMQYSSVTPMSSKTHTFSAVSSISRSTVWK